MVVYSLYRSRRKGRTTWGPLPCSWNSARFLFLGLVEICQTLKLRLFRCSRATLGGQLVCIPTAVEIDVMIDQEIQCRIGRTNLDAVLVPLIIWRVGSLKRIFLIRNALRTSMSARTRFFFLRSAHSPGRVLSHIPRFGHPKTL